MKKIFISVITIFACVICITSVNASSITVNDSISMNKVVEEFNALEDADVTMHFNETNQTYELKKKDGEEVISYIKLRYEDITTAQDSTHPTLVERKSIKYNLCSAFDEVDNNVCSIFPDITEEIAQNSIKYAKLLLKAVFAANGSANIESDTWDKVIEFYNSQGKYHKLIKIYPFADLPVEHINWLDIPLIGWEIDYALILAESNFTENDITAFNQLRPRLIEKSHEDQRIIMNPSLVSVSNIPNYEPRCYVYRSESTEGPYVRLNNEKYNCDVNVNISDNELSKSYYYKASLVGSPYLSDDTVEFNHQAPSNASSQENTKNPQTGVSSPVLLITTALTLSIIGYFCFKNKDALANFD